LITFSGAVNSKGPPKSAIQSTQSLRTPSNNSSTPHIVSARSSYHSLDADDEDDINNNAERLVPFSSPLALRSPQITALIATKSREDNNTHPPTTASAAIINCPQ
jgi:hypothetical protein